MEAYFLSFDFTRYTNTIKDDVYFFWLKDVNSVNAILYPEGFVPVVLKRRDS